MTRILLKKKKTVNVEIKYVVAYTTVYVLANKFTTETEIIKYINELICLTLTSCDCNITM